jgi:hypothetical protein
MSKPKFKLLTMDRNFTVERSAVEKVIEEIYSKLGRNPQKRKSIHQLVSPPNQVS